MEAVKEKKEQKKKLNHSMKSFSHSCDDLLEEKLATGTNEPIGLITRAETQRQTSKNENDDGSPVKGSGKKGRRRKISMPWFRQSSFGMGLQKFRLPKQHTIALTEPYHPDEVGTTSRALSVNELLHRKVRTGVWVAFIFVSVSFIKL